MPAKRPGPRLSIPPEDQMSAPQRALIAGLRSGPRGKSIRIGGPFTAFLQAPVFGDLAQRLGAHVRYHTALPPRLSEFAILCTARLWRAQYEWYAHEPMALKAGVPQKTINDLRAGRAPKGAKKDERAIYDFIQELYKKRRVSDRVYARVRAVMEDAAIVELIGILGYYGMISMTLNVFRLLPAPESKLPFTEPKV